MQQTVMEPLLALINLPESNKIVNSNTSSSVCTGFGLISVMSSDEAPIRFSFAGKWSCIDLRILRVAAAINVLA